MSDYPEVLITERIDGRRWESKDGRAVEVSLCTTDNESGESGESWLLRFENDGHKHSFALSDKSMAAVCLIWYEIMKDRAE